MKKFFLIVFGLFFTATMIVSINVLESEIKFFNAIILIVLLITYILVVLSMKEKI